MLAVYVERTGTEPNNIETQMNKEKHGLVERLQNN